MSQMHFLAASQAKLLAKIMISVAPLFNSAKAGSQNLNHQFSRPELERGHWKYLRKDVIGTLGLG